MSNRTKDLNRDIFVMDADGDNSSETSPIIPRMTTAPAWLNAVLSVAPVGKTLAIWGRLKQADR